MELCLFIISVDVLVENFRDAERRTGNVVLCVSVNLSGPHLYPTVGLALALWICALTTQSAESLLRCARCGYDEDPRRIREFKVQTQDWGARGWGGDGKKALLITMTVNEGWPFSKAQASNYQ